MSLTAQEQAEQLWSDLDSLDNDGAAARLLPLVEANEKLTGWLRKVAIYSNDGWLAQEARAEYVALTGMEPPL